MGHGLGSLLREGGQRLLFRELFALQFGGLHKGLRAQLPRLEDLGIEGLLNCGDSVFPGIGVPAVAASGANAASSSVSVKEHLGMLEKLYSI